MSILPPNPPVPSELSSSVEELELVDSLDLGSARGRRGAPSRGRVEVIRSLITDDLDSLRSPSPVTSPAQSLRQIRHSHHQLAQLLSQGTPQEEAALITGYSPSYISVLKDDPAFAELISYYSEQRELQVVDVYARMRTLGLSTLDELQRRLEENPEEYTIRLLIEQLETLMIKPMAAANSRGLPVASGGGNVQVSVNFVTANHTQGEGEAAPIIDVTPDKDFIERFNR